MSSFSLSACWVGALCFGQRDKLKFDTTKSDGQYKKTVTNARLRQLRPDYKFTPFKDAMKISTDWFRENYASCRK